LFGGQCGGFAGLSCEQDDAGFALMCDEDGLSIGTEEHEIGFPMSWVAPVTDGFWPLGD
jgi:hypothetical protein